MAAKANGLSNKAAMFFDQDIFQGIDGLDGLELNDDSAIELEDESDEKSKAKKSLSEKSIKKPKTQSQDPDDSEDSSSETYKALSKSARSQSKQTASSSDKIEIVPAKSTSGSTSWEDVDDYAATDNDPSSDPRKPNGQLDIDIITAEAMTLAQSLATGAQRPTDLVDDNFNKYTFRETEGLPTWFLDDETTHSQPNRPTTAAAAAAIRTKLLALNARPIKKVREARARKTLRAATRLEKLRKKSSLLAEDEALSERDKATTIAKMMSRAASKSKKPKEKVKLVVATGGNRGISGRPRGVKGKYKIVDKRLKKDVRAEKRVAKKTKKKNGGR